ncbi:MAG: 50S ribosomal protein L18 [Patescibacteria group bacterium]|nr:50S ribosomal protein L18 [Patescibacteria group bacterium]MBU1871042.1 50S ribosomal protein L18 [Patescibacteria group bacterium]
MNKQKEKQSKKHRRQDRVRVKINSTSDRPRLSVFKSNKGMQAQLIDDSVGKTLVSANSSEIKSKGQKTQISFEQGKLLAEKAKAKNINQVIFDRGCYKYHGRIKALADGAREGGLIF